MTTLALDSKNNLIAFGNFVTRSGIDAIVQDIKTLLLMWQGEYPFNLTKGLNYYDIVNKNSISLVKKEIRKRVMEDKRIINIQELSKLFGCEIVETYALKGQGTMEVAKTALKTAETKNGQYLENYRAEVKHFTVSYTFFSR